MSMMKEAMKAADNNASLALTIFLQEEMPSNMLPIWTEFTASMAEAVSYRDAQYVDIEYE